ncbi:hypothetical protein JX266_002484 [Neoarthrinium moseri]|nr:hypothetical protein JX266_002484 [Neoarthrinium moseri]
MSCKQPYLASFPASTHQLGAPQPRPLIRFLTGTHDLTNTTPIPGPVKKAAAVALLQDHDFFLHCDPHLTGYKALPPPTEPYESFKVPADIVPLGAASGDGHKVKLYEVTDHVPNPVWDSNVLSTEEFVDFADGVWVRIRSPMGVVMETTWIVREGEGQLELVEDVHISCNRMLMGIVKGSVEGNWRKIHEKIVARMVEDAKKGEGAP